MKNIKKIILFIVISFFITINVSAGPTESQAYPDKEDMIKKESYSPLPKDTIDNQIQAESIINNGKQSKIESTVMLENIDKIKSEKNDYKIYIIIIVLSITLSVITFVFKKKRKGKK